MNTFNRILVILAVLVLLVVCAVVFVVPIPILRAMGEWMEQVAVSLESLEGGAAVLRIALGILFALAWVVMCVLFLVWQIVPRRPKTVRLAKVDGGEVEVSLRTVEEHVSFAVDQLPGVLRVRSQVTARKGGVVIETEVDTAGDREVPARAAEVVELVRQVVEERVGVKLAQAPKVRLRAQPVPVVSRSRPQSEPTEED